MHCLSFDDPIVIRDTWCASSHIVGWVERGTSGISVVTCIARNPSWGRRRRYATRAMRSASSRRKTPRKPPKAARAAGRGRAPQDIPPTPPCARTSRTPSVTADARLQLSEPGVAVARGAGGVDQPEGIRRQLPQATTRMTRGKSGAKAPDRNRCPPRPGPPPRRASKEPNLQR